MLVLEYVIAYYNVPLLTVGGNTNAMFQMIQMFQ